MSNVGMRRIDSAPKPLGEHVDAYKCLGCGASFVANADAETFSTAPPLDCERCGGDMQAERYTKPAPAPTGGREAREWTLSRFTVDGPGFAPGEEVRVREVLSDADTPRGGESA